MCSKYTWWIAGNQSNESLCSYPLGTCVEDRCICADGYRNDLIFFRQRDCLLNERVLPIYGYIHLSISILAVLFTFRKMKGTSGEVFQCIRDCFICSIISLILSIHVLLNDFKQDSITCLIILAATAFNFMVCYRFAFILSIPLFKLARYDLGSIRNRFKMTWLFFRLIQIPPGLVGVIAYGNPDNPTFDNQFNLFTCHYNLTVAVEANILSLILYSKGYKLISIVQKIIDNSPKDAIPQTAKSYVVDTKSILNKGMNHIPGIILTYYFIPTMYFIFGYFPYCFIFYMINSSSIFIGLFSLPDYLIQRSVEKEERYQPNNTNATFGSSNILTSSLNPEHQIQSAVISISQSSEGPMTRSEVNSDMTTVNSVTNVVSASDPVLHLRNDDWRKRSNWVERLDEDGLRYYYNTQTKEHSFDPPKNA